MVTAAPMPMVNPSGHKPVKKRKVKVGEGLLQLPPGHVQQIPHQLHHFTGDGAAASAAAAAAAAAGAQMHRLQPHQATVHVAGTPSHAAAAAAAHMQAAAHAQAQAHAQLVHFAPAMAPGQPPPLLAGHTVAGHPPPPHARVPPGALPPALGARQRHHADYQVSSRRSNAQ